MPSRFRFELTEDETQQPGRLLNHGLLEREPQAREPE
jgi:hypothetical protein